MKRNGFTLTELIVVMAIISILALFGLPKYLNHSKEAQLTRIKVNIKELETASNKYYMTYNDWPRLSETPYTAEQVKEYGDKIYSKTGGVVILSETGKYYDIDFSKLSNYIKEPTDKNNYILQNPIGSIFYIDNLTEKGLTRESLETDGQGNVGNRTMLNLVLTGKTNTDTNKNIAEDLSGLGNNAELKNFNYNSSSGWASDGLLFDGVNDYVLIPTSANQYVKPTEELAVSVRAYSTNWQDPTRMTLISCTEHGGWNMGVNSSYGSQSGKGYLTFGVNTSGHNLNYSVTFIKLSDIPPGWHTFTAVYDGRYAKLYMDGVLYDSVDMGSYLDIIYNPNNALIIGGEASGGVTAMSGEYWKGKISSVSIYDRSLTSEEVKNVYQETKRN